jgi:sulfoxide reductase heme-binding subunit YedZ
MKFDRFVEKVLRPGVIILGSAPLVVLVFRLVNDQLGANPPEALERATGFAALWFLLASLSCTPLRRLTSRASFTRLRKPLGLWAFSYALIHLCCYLVFDQSLLFAEIGYDIVKRPYITVGFAGFLILLALAVTSPSAVARRLGGRRWKALHRLAYLAAALGVLHFLWLVKLDVTRPVTAAIFLVAVLLLRLPQVTGGAAAAPARPLGSKA